MAVYVEATPDETEARLLRGLRKRLPGPAGATWGWSRRWPRCGGACPTGKKVAARARPVRAWLHAQAAEQDTELVEALRQCDGGRVQASSWCGTTSGMAATRFMDALEVRIVQGHNFAAVDLFDVDHARQGAGAVRPGLRPLPAGPPRPVRRAAGSSWTRPSPAWPRDGKVISVRLALFAEMVKGKPWTPATLRGGRGAPRASASTFLEETFSSRSASPRHRLHQQAARAS